MTYLPFALLKRGVDEYVARFPTSFNPSQTAGTLWRGSGNYMARDMALLYLITGNEEYARDVIGLLTLVRENTPFCSHLCQYGEPTPFGENTGGLLSGPWHGGIVFQSALFGYLAVRDTDLLTDSDRAEFDGFLTHQALLLEEVAQRSGERIPLSSWLNRNVPVGANMAALTIAAAFPDSPDMQRLGARIWPRLEWQLGNWWEADGGWGENTEWYGFRVLEEALLLAETLQRTRSEDLYYRDFDGSSLHSMCRFFLDILTPEGTTPLLNDTGESFVDPGLFDLCGYRSADPELYFAADAYWWGRSRAFGVNSLGGQPPFHPVAWAGLRDQDPSMPPRTSLLLSPTGVAILRSNWSHIAQYALIQFTASRVHNEQSFGALYLFDNGPWLVGNGYHGGDESQAGAPTDQHSTLGVDRANQSSTGGEAIAFADLEGIGIAAVRGRSYPDLQHTRTLLWTKAQHLWLVIDDVSGTSEQGTLQLRWYVRGGLLTADDRIWSFGREGQPGRLWIVMTSPLPASYSRIGRHYDWDEHVNDAVGVEMETDYAGGSARLVTLLAPSSLSASAPDFTRLDFPDGSLLDVSSSEGSWRWMIPTRADRAADIGDFEVLGSAACSGVPEDALGYYCLLNGTALSYQDIDLVRAATPVYLEASTRDGWLVIDAGSSTQLGLFWPWLPSAISDGDTPVQFEYHDSTLHLALEAGRHSLSLAP